MSAREQFSSELWNCAHTFIQLLYCIWYIAHTLYNYYIQILYENKNWKMQAKIGSHKQGFYMKKPNYFNWWWLLTAMHTYFAHSQIFVHSCIKKKVEQTLLAKDRGIHHQKYRKMVHLRSLWYLFCSEWQTLFSHAHHQKCNEPVVGSLETSKLTIPLFIICDIK